MAGKKRVAGVVDRVEGDTAVVIIRDPDDSKSMREIYVDKKKLKKTDLNEGDRVTVEMSVMRAEEESTSVTLIFNGLKSGDMAKKFFTYLVDGGLEDQVIQALSGNGVTLAIEDFSKKRLAVLFECMKEQPTETAKKTVKKPVKKAVKKPVKAAKKSVKKTVAKRPTKR